jgi:MerR family transcriptional regulator, mercuric resistance operon regulatory protein
MSGRGLTIGRLAISAGVNLETVRYYERTGLMPEPGRTSGGHRAYEPVHLERLRFIRRSRELGFGTDAIRKLIALSEPSLQSCAQVKGLATEHVAAVDARIADLQRLRAVLQQAIIACDNGEQVCCPVIAELGSP